MIHPIPGVRGAQAFLLEQPEGLAVIDPGYTGGHAAVLRFLDALGFAAQDLRWVLLTHHHVDHGGSALELCRRTNATLHVHVADAPYLGPRRPRERMTIWGMVDRLPGALARFIATSAPGIANLLQDGEAVAGLRVIHAPGHTPGSICLWSERESALFLGDVLNNERGLRRPPWTVNHDHRRARAAARRLLGLQYEKAFFGHGSALTDGASAKIARFVESEEMR